MADYFQPGNPDIGFSGKDQDRPRGISIGSSDALRELGGVLAGEQGFESTPSAMDREYTSQVLTAGLSARIQTLEGKMATGAEYVDNFNRINSTTLGSPNPGVIPVWTQFGTGQPLELIDQAAQIEQGGLLPDDGTRYALCPQASSSNDFSVMGIVHPLSKTGKIAGKARTTIYGRCNAAGTEGVYVDFWGADGNTLPHCEIGRFTRSGNSLSRSQWRANAERSYSFSSTIELRMIGTRYIVVVDGVEIIDHIDTSNFPVDGNHRYSMFSCMTWTGFFGAKPQFSAGLTQFAIRGVDLTAIQQATNAAANAEAAAAAVVGIAENADAKATAAQETANSVEDIALAAQTSADVAYAAAARWKDEFIVASAGVVLGKNELALGVVMDVPSGRTRKISRIIYGLITNTGSMTVQLISTSPNRVSTVIHTTSIPAGVVEFIDNSPDISVLDGHRISCNVTVINGNSSVLQCALIGALI